MDKSIFASRASIRTVLLAALLVLGGWGISASLQRIDESLHNYRQSRNLAEWSRVAVHLLTAAQHLAYERGRAAVVLRAAEPVSAKDRAFLDERRRQSDASLAAAIDSLQSLPEASSSGLQQQWQQIKLLRQQVDHDAALRRAERDPDLANRWFDSASAFIRRIQLTTEDLVRYFRPGEMTTRLTLLAASALELRITAGVEASAIAQALSAGEAPGPERMYRIHELRGREDRLWQEIDRLVGYIDIAGIRNQAKEVKAHHLNVFRPRQSEVLAGLAARRQPGVSVPELTSLSLPTLDGISKLMTLTTENALQLADEGMTNARAILIRHTLWFASILALVVLSLFYVIRHVVHPLEQVDGELRRLGALPLAAREGNEIDRLKASAEALQRSLAARDEAEARLKSTNAELNAANAKLQEYVAALTASHAEVEKAYKELQAAESRMLQQEKMASIGQLAAGVAHEINNPLGFVITNLGMLGKYASALRDFLHAQEKTIARLAAAAPSADANRMSELERLRDGLEIDFIIGDIDDVVAESLDGGNRMKRIVQNLRNFARLNEQEFKMANINEGLDSTLNIAAAELQHKATVTKDYGDIPSTLCNLGELNQAFLNLLINAGQAIEKHGEIRLETRRDGESIVVSIADTGCGIPADKMNRIFEPFFTTKAIGVGTGLGLSIVYDIVKKHGGDIAVDSEVGKGTRFTIRLPIRDELDAAA